MPQLGGELRAAYATLSLRSLHLVFDLVADQTGHRLYFIELGLVDFDEFPYSLSLEFRRQFRMPFLARSAGRLHGWLAWNI